MRPEDLFLEWLSELGSGDWNGFRESWTWLLNKGGADRGQDQAGAAAATLASNLSALGYLEMNWGDQEWCIAPPAITLLPNSGGRALLTGARTRALCRLGPPGADPTGHLADVSEELGLWPHSFSQLAGPSTLVIALEDPQQACELASRCEIGFSYSTSEQLSMMLPGLSLALKGFPPSDVPQGFDVERFDPASLEWLPSSEDEVERPGLSRVITWKRHVHLLTLPSGITVEASRQYGIFEVLRWEQRKVIDYDPETWELWTPWNTRLPLLEERAAVLCSGVLPRPEKRGMRNGWKHYNVPPDIATRITGGLSQVFDLE